MNDKINDIIDNMNINSEEELQDRLNELKEKYAEFDKDFTSNDMEEAYELLELAKCTKSKKKAYKLAEEAYLKCPDCIEAFLFMIDLEDSTTKQLEMLEDAIKREEDKLNKGNYFKEENIGEFHSIPEARPYLRALFMKVTLLLKMGKMSVTKDLCNELLRFNTNDDLGVRYTLMAIYAFLEDEENAINLYNKYPEESFFMLFPLFILYYKLGNDEKALEYLSKSNSTNNNLIKLFKGELDDDDSIPGYYNSGSPSELKMYFMFYSFLLYTVPSLDEYVLNNL